MTLSPEPGSPTFEQSVSEAIEALRRQWLDQGGTKTGALCDWLAPRVVAAIQRAYALGYTNGTEGQCERSALAVLRGEVL